MSFLRSPLLFVLLLVAACDYTEPTRIIAGIDFDHLFARPTASEIAAVEADWAARDVSARSVRLERISTESIDEVDHQVFVVSHVVAGVRHVGAMLYPDGASAQSLPVIMYLHGGDSGVSVDSEVLVLVELVRASIGDFVMVVPSFRSETLIYGGESFTSEGPPSPWDYDVDDTMALLSVALDLVPGSDPDRVAVAGFSRGAGVALLMSARDDRVDRVVEFFGPTDFFGPFAQDVVEEALLGSRRDLPGLVYLDDNYIQPLAAGTIPVSEARDQLVRRSAVLFAEAMPPVQLHHGTADPVVPVSQAESLIRTMNRLGKTQAEFEPYLYEGGGHNPLTLTDSFERAMAFLLPLANGS